MTTSNIDEYKHQSDHAQRGTQHMPPLALTKG